ncbi:MAG: hypothetical protein JO100_09860 [Pseudonocardia sp.]|nr:hypothetical protein [Pseudonocardia sp.]
MDAERSDPTTVDPRRVHDLDDLARELGLLLIRAARGTGQAKVSLAELTRRLNLPASSKSTVHSYVSGHTLAPAEVLDRIVIALGAAPDEQRRWSEAWFRVSAWRENARRGPATGGSATSRSVLGSLADRLRRTENRPTDVYAISAQNLDLTHQVDYIGPDHEEEVAEPVRGGGGSGSNTVLALARLGLRTGVVGAVGADQPGEMLRRELTEAGVDTTLLLTVKRGGGTGQSMVFADAEGRRSIYVFPGVNEQLAREIEARTLHSALGEKIARTRILHVSSFTGAAERHLQESLVAALHPETLVTVNPGALYSGLGADRLTDLLTRANVLFCYEQQLDRLLAKSSARPGAPDSDVTDKVSRLYQWRARREAQQPLVIIVKRPIDLVRGRSGEYLVIGYGRSDLEELGGPDADTRTRRQEIVDSTGAGDALAAGFLYGLLRRADHVECANLAYVMAMSASATLGARAGLPGEGELGARWLEHLPDVPVPLWLQRRPDRTSEVSRAVG